MIYITVTTVPDRMENTEIYTEFLHSLMNQDVSVPYKIVLNIPLNFKNYTSSEIPNWLVSFLNNHTDKFIILRDEIDYGPICNLIYPLKHINMDENDIIIVCDDDHSYHESMVSYHLKKLNEYPHNHSICFRGNRPTELRKWFDGNTEYGKFYQTHIYFPVKHDIYLEFPDHWHSVSYRRHFFKDDIFDKEFLSMSWNNDQLMAFYAKLHKFYFLCAHWDKETDFRPVNYDGRAAASFPIKRMLPTIDQSGCNFYRRESSDVSQKIWDNKKFYDVMSVEETFVVNEKTVNSVEKPIVVTPTQISTITPNNTVNMQENVIVTMTTVPKRLNGDPTQGTGIQPGLKTILEQSNVKYEVHLNIPYSYKFKRVEIPSWLEEWTVKYPHLKIFRTPDYGAITKIYPTIKRVTDPNAILITADDDLFYEDGFVLGHLDGMKRYPGCAIGYAGITSIEPDRVGRYHYASSTPEDIRVRLLEGYKTVSYRRHYFDDDLDKFVFSHWNDDVAISAYLGYKDIIKMVLKCQNCNENYSPRVESFPVISHVPIESDTGCNVFRRDDEVIKSGDIVANEWYHLKYLEK